MSSPLPDWWIAPAGLHAVETDPEATAIPDSVLADPDLSLMAKGIYALALAYQGQPINPYDDAVENPAEIADALDELVRAVSSCGSAGRARPDPRLRLPGGELR